MASCKHGLSSGLQEYHKRRQLETTRRRGEVITRLQGSNTNYCDWRVITARGRSMRILRNYCVHDLSSLILDSVRIADTSTSRGAHSWQAVGRRGAWRGSIRKLHWSYCLEAKKTRKNLSFSAFCLSKKTHKTLKLYRSSPQNNDENLDQIWKFWILGSSRRLQKDFNQDNRQLDRNVKNYFAVFSAEPPAIRYKPAQNSNIPPIQTNGKRPSKTRHIMTISQTYERRHRTRRCVRPAVVWHTYAVSAPDGVALPRQRDTPALQPS